MADEQITLLFDMKLRKPACVLLQAAAGCAANNSFLSMTFESKDWLVFPTPDMARITGTRAQWEGLAAKMKAKS